MWLWDLLYGYENLKKKCAHIFPRNLRQLKKTAKKKNGNAELTLKKNAKSKTKQENESADKNSSLVTIGTITPAEIWNRLKSET